MSHRPLPTALHELHGNPSHKTLNKNEPHPRGIPECPNHLDEEAKKEWKRISSELVRLNLLTVVDRAALAAYCASWSRWIDADSNVQKFGSVIKSPKSGFPIANPYVGISNRSLTLMHKFLVEFGLTPASRSKIEVASTLDNDAFEQFMANIGAEDITTNTETE
jgi:P27 family predicted phage terminase small subunit